MPSHTGKWNRVCVQAKIQGIARRLAMLPAALRFAGREPMFIRPSSFTGVACCKVDPQQCRQGADKGYGFTVFIPLDILLCYFPP
jgi:hypothetical protein